MREGPCMGISRRVNRFHNRRCLFPTLQFLDNDGLRHVLTLLRDDPDKGVRSKAQYAVSGAIKHFPEALEAFAGMGGYDVLGEVITRADDPPTLRKIIFLYNTLMAEDPATAPVLRDNGTVAKLEEVLGKFGEDEDMVEKVGSPVSFLVVVDIL
ncbi:hypothetical protein BC938DRAFT_482402 [Jimgerdemannia flammicorona]|uniref:Armadillo-type protein n=1 Tax=Jimgerdemannia flammicorona TaxID=994334 RepID=A0A433QE29_9FUNG|nr:hypothetical protein BC938DRAFT_482402 [Jimgerdemannia flammicorona]